MRAPARQTARRVGRDAVTGGPGALIGLGSHRTDLVWGCVRVCRLSGVAEAIRVKYGGILAVARRLNLQHSSAFVE